MKILMSGILVLTLTTAAAAQQSSAVKLPAACTAAAEAGGHAAMVSKSEQEMSQRMTDGMKGMEMTATQKGLHKAMVDMHGPMMRGLLAKDADVAWICAMIPHHQGAIDMARAGLLGADDKRSRQMAEKTIRDQEKEIAKLTAWLSKNASSQTGDKAAGSR